MLSDRTARNADSGLCPARGNPVVFSNNKHVLEAVDLSGGNIALSRERKYPFVREHGSLPMVDSLRERAMFPFDEVSLRRLGAISGGVHRVEHECRPGGVRTWAKAANQWETLEIVPIPQSAYARGGSRPERIDRCPEGLQ